MMHMKRKPKPYPVGESRAYLLKEPEAMLVYERYGTAFDRPDIKLQTARRGLEAVALEDFIRLFGGTQEEVARLLRISDKTLRAYVKERRNLDTGISEHLLQLFELFDKGAEMFGGVSEFRKWLATHNHGLNETPVKLLDTYTGMELVTDELSRIAFGATA